MPTINAPGVTKKIDLIQCDGVTSGTTQLANVQCNTMPTYATFAVVVSTGYFYTLVPITGITPDGVTVIRASDGVRDWFGGPGAITQLNAAGDVTATGPGAVAATIVPGAVSNVKLALAPAHTYKGNNTGGLNTVLDLTQAQLASELNAFIAVSNLPNDVAAAGDVLATAIAAPATPAAGKGRYYVDSTSKNLAVINDAGVVNHGIQTKAAVSHQWITSVANDGSSVLAQPAFTDISGTATIAQGGTGQGSAGAAFDALANSSWSIAAAATTDLSTVAGISGTVTGTTGVTTTALGTMPRGTRRTVTCGGGGLVWTVSHSAAIVCPGATGLVFVGGDCVEFESLGSGNWQVLSAKWAAIGFSYNNSAQPGINLAGNNLMQFGTGFILANTYFRANGTPGAAGTPQYTYQADTTSGSYAIASGDIGHSVSSTQQFHINAHGLVHNTRHQTTQGGSIASATTITLTDANLFALTGTTPVTGITTTSWQAGSSVYLQPGSASITFGNLATAGGIKTRTGAAVAPVANAIYEFIYDGTNWWLMV
jgi:hypothetical protein